MLIKSLRSCLPSNGQKGGQIYQTKYTSLTSRSHLKKILSMQEGNQSEQMYLEAEKQQNTRVCESPLRA